MRLIDADALIAQMEEDAEQMEDSIAKMFAYAAINDVKHAPTIEERKTGRAVYQAGYADGYKAAQQERKTGEWMELDFTEAWEYRCDQCGRRSDFKENFCPNCGADMRGEEHDKG